MALFVTLVMLLAWLGHLALCVGVFNRVAGSRLPCSLVGWIERTCLVLMLVVPATFAFWLWQGQVTSYEALVRAPGGIPWLAYLTLCVLAACWVLPDWFRRKFAQQSITQLVSNDTEYHNIAQTLGHWPVGKTSSRLMAYFPGNEICRLAVPTKTLRLERLPQKLDGLSIVHLSDLHYTGQLTLDFYQYAIDRANELAGDLVVITGDIVDKTPCIDWIPHTLGRLQAKHGVYFVLGNHDKRVADVEQLRRALTQCGLKDVGGRAATLQINDTEVHLAGNELPWFGLRANLDVFKPHQRDHEVLRILLSHSPDQYEWARQRGYDLMLAGHCHGGQVRLPYIGPIVCPSLHGTKYAGGLYYEAPTLLHVTRGLAGTHPLRLNCQPELAKLVLRCPYLQAASL